MGVKLQLFNDIITAIETVTVIKTTGLWNNQFDNEATERAFNYPAVFIEFTSITWSRTHQTPNRDSSVGNVNDEQDAPDTVITLHIGFSELKSATQVFAAIDATLELIYFAVHGIEGTQYTKLVRMAERQDTDHDRITDWQMDFTCQMTQQGVLDTDLELIAAGTLTLEQTRDIVIQPGTETGVRTDDKI